MALNVAGLVAILLFYALILGVGIYAAWRRRSKKDNSDEIILAGRSIGPFGLLYCQAPFGYAISLVLDPLQESYGQRWGCALYLPALFGETLWTASILAALGGSLDFNGSTLSVILDLPDAISIVVSASIAVLYTLVGGLYSVAYTDVVQLFCIAIGLWLAVPFSLHSEYSGSLNPNTTNWLGEPPNNPYEWGTWWDYAFLLICGGIPWQVIHFYDIL
ncbi:hypothetical protein HAZT_HAZT001812 [Hyalella azteca]|uniref:Uncharacterized protein n=1 Tax=Hyalella azteca TaxID=294128 RepID=A0A6A0H9C7_HYAAZ|nr:hypothetical protein HAZT_HAZT001812 [Hyalella azteca]